MQFLCNHRSHVFALGALKLSALIIRFKTENNEPEHLMDARMLAITTSASCTLALFTVVFILRKIFFDSDGNLEDSYGLVLLRCYTISVMAGIYFTVVPLLLSQLSDLSVRGIFIAFILYMLFEFTSCFPITCAITVEQILTTEFYEDENIGEDVQVEIRTRGFQGKLGSLGKIAFVCTPFKAATSLALNQCLLTIGLYSDPEVISKLVASFAFGLFGCHGSFHFSLLSSQKRSARP